MKSLNIGRIFFLAALVIVAILTACSSPSADSIRGGGSKSGPVSDGIIPSITENSLTFKANSKTVLTLAFNTDIEIVDKTKIRVEVKAKGAVEFSKTPVSGSRVDTTRKKLLELTLSTNAVDGNIYKVKVGTGALKAKTSNLANKKELTSGEVTYSTSPILDRASPPYILNNKLVATFNLSIEVKDWKKVKVYKNPAGNNQEITLQQENIAVKDVNKNLLEITLPTVVKDEVYRLKLDAGAVNKEDEKTNVNKAISPEGLDITIEAAPALDKDNAPSISEQKIIVTFDGLISILTPDKIKYQLDGTTITPTNTPTVQNNKQLVIPLDALPAGGQVYRIELDIGAITGKNTVPSLAIKPNDMDIIIWDIMAVAPVSTSATEFNVTFPASMEIADKSKIKVEVKADGAGEFSETPVSSSRVDTTNKNLLELTLSTAATTKNVYRVKVEAGALRKSNQLNTEELTSGEAIYFASLFLDGGNPPYIMNNKLIATFNLPIALKDWRKVKVYKNPAGESDGREIILTEPNVTINSYSKNLLEITLPAVTKDEVYRLKLDAGAVREEDRKDNENKAIEPKDRDIAIKTAPSLTANPVSMGQKKIILTFDGPISILAPDKIKYHVDNGTPAKPLTSPEVNSNNKLEITLNLDPSEGEVYHISLEAGALGGGKNQPSTGNIRQEVIIPEIDLLNVIPAFASETEFSVSFQVEVGINDDDSIDVQKKNEGESDFVEVVNRTIAVDSANAQRINITLTEGEEIIPYTQAWRVVFRASALETATSSVPNLNELTTYEIKPRITDLYSWKEARTKDKKWDARRLHTSVIFNDRIWVMGGKNGAKYFNDVWSSPDGETWEESTPPGGTDKSTVGTSKNWWKKRSSHTSVVFHDKIWVMGGRVQQYLNDIWSSPDGSRWIEEAASANWSPRFGHTSVVFNPDGNREKIWVMGGNDGRSLNDVWSSTDGSRWIEEITAAKWSPRFGHTSVVFDPDESGKKIWIIGGNSNGNGLDDVWSSTDGSSWTNGINLLNTAYYASTVKYNDRLWIIGGGAINTKNFYSNGDLNENWIEEKTLSLPISATQAVEFKDKIWLLGGDYDGSMTNTIWNMGRGSE